MKISYQYFKRTIATGEIHDINAYGRFITLLSNNGSSNVKVNIAGQGFQELPAGISVELPETNTFNLLQFQNTSGISVVVEFSLSNGRIYDNRTNIVNRLLTSDTGQIFDSPAALAVDDTGNIKIAADPDTLQVLIQNNDAANAFWIGDTNVDPATNRGVKLEIGDSVVINSRADIVCRCAAALTAVGSYVRVKKG